MAVSIDKGKLIDQAQKYIQKGQFDKAISEYQKIVEADSKDIRTRLKLGELYLKVGNNASAVNEYSTAAESYTSDGFILQAIAVFKQLLKIDPSISDIYLKLAKLYKKQGLIADALAQFQIVIANYEKQGKTAEATGALKDMASMDPENFSIRAKLAGLYLKGGDDKKALEEFSQIANDLKKKGRMDDVIILYEKLLSAKPTCREALNGIGEAYLETGKIEKALDSLKVALKSDPNDTTTLSLLSKVYLELNDEQSAKLTYKNILRVDPSYDDARKELTKLLIKEGNYDEGMETALPFIDKALEGKNSDGALGILLEFYRNDVREPRLLDKMANAYRIKGEREKEKTIREELSQLTGEAPKVEETTEAVAVEPEQETLGTEEAQKEPPMEEHFAHGGKETDEPVKDVYKYLTEAEVYVKYGLADKAIEILNTALNAFPENTEVRKKLASLEVVLPEEAEEVLPEIEEVSMEVEAQEEVAPQEIEEVPELEIDKEVTAEITGEQPRLEEEKYPLSKIKEDMEEADFYIQQGLYEDARNICSRILEFHPENEETLSKLRTIDISAQTILPAPVPPHAESAVESFFDLAAELDGEEFETLTTPSGMREAEKFGFEDIFSEFKKGVDTQLEKEDTETHYNLGIAYKEMGLLDDAIREFRIASADHKIEFDCYNLIGICYVEKEDYKKAVETFRKGLQLPGISDDEHASMNYELGTAYELSGMTGEALSAYMETSKKNSGFRDVQSKISQLGGSRETKRGRVSYV
jgi:tetratricopeptide (TPR) repeat protein